MGSDADETDQVDEFGRSLSLDGDTLLVGAWGGYTLEDSGDAYLFRRLRGGS